MVYICEIGSVNTSFGDRVGYEKGTIVAPSGVSKSVIKFSRIFAVCICLVIRKPVRVHPIAN